MKRLFAGLALAATVISPAMADEHQVIIRGMSFQPSTLEVSAGDTVMFVNRGRAAHTATATGGGVDTGRIAAGEAARVTISSAGVLDYVCAYHPAMRGRITAR